ncbi:transposase [Candidatus Daviesbacteria bacterium]|nr:transposase [Candidatus Daviesbacteria bacterium]
MPGRIVPLANGEVYHVFNRGINRQPTFINRRDYQRAQETINFYRFLKPPISLSKFLRLEDYKQDDVLKILKQSNKLIEIFCYCLMPNHFHFLARQMSDKGIAKFLSNLQNSYTRYFNIRHERDGSLFLDQFKAVRIETDEQLIHVSRYIHLNPHTGYVVKTLEELERYPWSSFPDYLNGQGQFTDLVFILSFFGSVRGYKKFVFDQADYQRKLKEIKHLVLE